MMERAFKRVAAAKEWLWLVWSDSVLFAAGSLSFFSG